MLWKNNTNIPELGQRIKCRDNNGIIYHGIFDMLGEQWRVADLVGGLNTLWRDVIEWQGFEPVLIDAEYQNFLLTTIESELA